MTSVILNSVTFYFVIIFLNVCCGVIKREGEEWKKEIESRLSFLENQINIQRLEKERLKRNMNQISECIDSAVENGLEVCKRLSYPTNPDTDRFNTFSRFLRELKSCRINEMKINTQWRETNTTRKIEGIHYNEKAKAILENNDYRSNLLTKPTDKRKRSQQFFQENVALGKHVSMTNSVDKFPGSNAVDGNALCCSSECTNISVAASSGKSKAQWSVDLGQRYTIHNIKIHSRVDLPNNYANILAFRGRLAGFALYISNTTRREDGYMCYNDLEKMPTLPPLVLNIECLKHGRYVIYYNERRNGSSYPNMYSKYAYADLCEVEVFGCTSTVGGFCIKACPENCEDDRCDIVTGTCVACKAGWRGPKCNQKCELGKHGPNCLLECNNNCLVNEGCNHVTGKCNGCASGWTGKSCTQVCSIGKYGPSCALDCGSCMNGLTCDRVTGYCKECQHGFLPPFCRNRTENQTTDLIAFYATLSRSSLPGLHLHETIIFDEIKTNKGDGYHGYDGIFVVPKSGLYGFTWNVMVQDQGVSSTEIVVNGNVQGTTMASGLGSGSRDVGTGFVILQVSRGDHVYIRMHESGSGSVVSDARGMSSFSGWMLN